MIETVSTPGARVTFVRNEGALAWHDFNGDRHTHEPVSAYTKDASVQVVGPGTFHTLNVQVEDSQGHRFDVAADALLLVVPDPEPLDLAPGDRAVVESDIFARPGGAIGTHSEFNETGRPEVGAVVTIVRKCETTGDYETSTGFRVSPEGLVPAPKFVPGDRVVLVGTPYIGSTRLEGAVGTVVTAAPGELRGINRPDYAVDLDGDYYGVWGFREYHLAPEPKPEPEPAEEAVEEFEVGDKVLVGEDFAGSDKYAGTVGTVAYPKDADGDYMVEFEGGGYADGDYSYFAPSELAPVVEEPVAEETPDSAYSIPVRFIAGVTPEAKPEDYALRLEVSAKAADILARAGFVNVLGSDVAALAEFLLGIAKRES